MFYLKGLFKGPIRAFKVFAFTGEVQFTINYVIMVNHILTLAENYAIHDCGCKHVYAVTLANLTWKGSLWGLTCF